MHPASQSVVDFAMSVCASDPQAPQPQLHDAMVPPVLHALASDSAFGLASLPALMVGPLGMSQADADAMAAKIAAVQSACADLNAAVEAVNASIGG